MDLWPPELQNNKFVWYNAYKFGDIHCGSNRKLKIYTADLGRPVIYAAYRWNINVGYLYIFYDTFFSSTLLPPFCNPSHNANIVPKTLLKITNDSLLEKPKQQCLGYEKFLIRYSFLKFSSAFVSTFLLKSPSKSLTFLSLFFISKS